MFPHSLAAGPLPHGHGGPGPSLAQAWNESVVLSAPHPTPNLFWAFGATRNWDSVESAGLESTGPRFKSWFCF